MNLGPDDFDSVARMIRARRTSMIVDKSRDVGDDVLDELFELAAWAPCHKRTWPWRFAVVRGESRSTLGHTVADAMQRFGDEPDKVAKARTKYTRTPVVVVVGSVVGDSDQRTAENRDATSVAVQNFMLGATARGIATYWGSCPKGADADVATLCGFETDTKIVALVYVGWATSAVEAPERPQPIVTRLS
ncbi:MAG: nitroreductase [Actinomycetota bacterium]